jgi:hypothetical protein
MNTITRRTFLGSSSAALASASLSQAASPTAGSADARGQSVPVDFRYSPLSWQTAYCFPDDRFKSLVGERGDLRYGHPGPGKPIDYFPVVVEFSLLGVEPDTDRRQWLEAPDVPVVHTLITRPEGLLELTAFATRLPDEGRVDNVMLEVRPRSGEEAYVRPMITVRTKEELQVKVEDGVSLVFLGRETEKPFLVADGALDRRDIGTGWVLTLPAAVSTAGKPVVYFLRFPQESQPAQRVVGGLKDPARLTMETRTYWKGWIPFGGDVRWKLAGRHHEFLVACARNIQQAREERNGKLTFQVGPTVYRGLWVVDGHFILEAARYLGYDAEAQQGLEATWARQEADGGIFAGGGREHWKDTGIAMFTLVRQAELSGNWDYFRTMQPQILRGVRFLAALRDKAKAEGSANGRYGLLARGFPDGGIAGLRSEFTNTLWALVGLQAVVEASERLRLTGFEEAKSLHDGLRQALSIAMREEMRRHARGFDYLPMLMKEDPQWSADNKWQQPRPQGAQWALSQAIYPGILFEKDDPVVRGHIALMQACTQEDVPAETGWIQHGGLWNYGAAFVAHAYLWASLTDWARLTFTGFLNHATPLYCWREEQPLRGAMAAGYVGDMPHNWASAECVLYLRHMLALEDGPALRLLPGIGDPELAAAEPCTITASPTRFGRVSLSLEPLPRAAGWRLSFQRQDGPSPGAVQLPAALGSRLVSAEVSGAASKRDGTTILVEPGARSWACVWKAG